MVDTNKDSEVTKDDLFGNNDKYFHVSPWKDTNVESNFEEIRILDVTLNVSDADANINFGE